MDSLSRLERNCSNCRLFSEAEAYAQKQAMDPCNVCGVRRLNDSSSPLEHNYTAFSTSLMYLKELLLRTPGYLCTFMQRVSALLNTILQQRG